MNARSYPRTAMQAFPNTCDYACAVECFKPSIFASTWFWLGGIASVAAWTVIAIVCLAVAR